MDYKKIGEYIKQKRKQIGLTQAELSEKLNLTSKAISKWECGVAMPDISLFPELCEILNISVVELLQGCDKEKDAELENDLKNKKKNRTIIILTIISLFFLLLTIIFGIYFIKNYNKVHIYDLVSSNPSFTLDGKVIKIKDQSYVSISNIKYIPTNKGKSNYSSLLSYELYYNDECIFTSGKYNELSDLDDIDISRVNKNLENVYIFESTDEIKSINNNSLYLKVYMLGTNNKIMPFTINISYY